MLPLVVAKGAGAEMNQALGTAVFAGMNGVTFFGIFFTPVFFSVIIKIFTRPSKKKQPGSIEQRTEGKSSSLGSALLAGSKSQIAKGVLRVPLLETDYPSSLSDD
jgi:hypothetical protein